MTVFISYASEQQDVAAHVSAYLERNGIQTWFAGRDIALGSPWSTAISDAITEASLLLVLFSAEADRSAQVNRELSLADSQKMPILWVRLHDVQPDRLGYFLLANQWFDWLDRRDVTLEGLVAALRSNSGSVLDAGAPPVSEAIAAARSPEPAADSQATGWPYAVVVLPNEAQAATAAARFTFRSCQEQMGGTLVLPTRSAAAKLFQAMLRVVKDYGPQPFGDAILTNDTETFGVTFRHPTSRSRQVQVSLIDPLRERGVMLPDESVRLMAGVYLDDDPLETAQELLRRHPPFLHVISVSPAGEIIGYEVGTYTDADEMAAHQVRVVELGEAGKRYLEPNQPSNSIVTIGLGNCLSSEVLLVLAFDHRKARIIKQIVTRPETPGIPASLLRRHQRAIVVTTRRIVSEVSLSDFETFSSVDECVEWLSERAAY